MIDPLQPTRDDETKQHISERLSGYRICRLAGLLCGGALRRAGDLRIPIPKDHRSRRTRIRSRRRICVFDSDIGGVHAQGCPINIGQALRRRPSFCSILPANEVREWHRQRNFLFSRKRTTTLLLQRQLRSANQRKKVQNRSTISPIRWRNSGMFRRMAGDTWDSPDDSA
jgi:hypothetical protein